MTRILILFLTLSLAACNYVDPIAALQQQPVTVTPSPTTDTHPNMLGSAELPQCTVTGALNVRSGPGVSHAVIGYLYAGDIVTIQTQRGAWLNIGNGWIHSKYCMKGK